MDLKSFPTRRRARHVGRVRIRLAEMLEKALTAEGHQVRVHPEDLSPAQGYWRTDHRADVLRWEGQFDIWRYGKWDRCSVDSWDPMTDCIKGFSISWDKTYSVEVHATNVRTHPVIQRMKVTT